MKKKGTKKTKLTEPQFKLLCRVSDAEGWTFGLDVGRTEGRVLGNLVGRKLLAVRTYHRRDQVVRLTDKGRDAIDEHTLRNREPVDVSLVEVKKFPKNPAGHEGYAVTKTGRKTPIVLIERSPVGREWAIYLCHPDCPRLNPTWSLQATREAFKSAKAVAVRIAAGLVQNRGR